MKGKEGAEIGKAIRSDVCIMHQAAQWQLRVTRERKRGRFRGRGERQWNMLHLKPNRWARSTGIRREKH